MEGRLSDVAKLSAATAKGWGKDKATRQVAVYASGVFRTKLSALWESWKAGAAAARSGGAEGSGGTKPTPWKQQVLVALVEQLAE